VEGVERWERDPQRGETAPGDGLDVGAGREDVGAHTWDEEPTAACLGGKLVRLHTCIHGVHIRTHIQAVQKRSRESLKYAF